jgi:excisionase family DNA binding protein
MSGQAEGPAAAAGKLLYSVDEAAELLGIGRTYTFRLVAAGEIDSLKIGKRRMIPGDALERYIERLRSQSAAIASSPGEHRPDRQKSERRNRRSQ